MIRSRRTTTRTLSPAATARGAWYPHRTVIVLVIAAVTLAVAAACGDGGGDSAGAGTPVPDATALSVTDAWVKSAESGQTGAFCTLTNNMDRPITIVSGTSSASASVELHEVAMSNGKSVMRPKVGGFVVQAHATYQLKPGGDHLMLMGLKGAVKAGDQVSFTLTRSDGSTLEFTAVAKDFAAGNEDYHPGASGTGGTG